ncbi:MULTISPECIES: ParB/RepB/Spo0J family partition protein [Herbaspirillum]|uniref:ParB/RepB/Spo0J family partition protein n=1 Tax=Herbaspirillum TaxID=963 RepID=UPI000949D518|nr:MULTISPECIES: ParB/RepB/Spo0J family partition protein [Herbaspirillum]MDR6398292.1 ParB family chromosome partitioning protein [Herbaspirillum seropedicae]QDD66987.1 ParB/RepB/Spo0J family partition protein [Herbaspirillum seropedicae]
MATLPKKSKGLGRGLDALLGGSSDITEEAQAQAAAQGLPTVMPVTELQAGKYQPRTRMDEGALNELAASIKEQGLLQPILIRAIGQKNGRDTYEIIAGERRFRAAKIAGLTEVPVLVRNVDDQTTAAMALIENMQREDLNPLEEAQGIHRLITDFAFTHEQAAIAVGRSRSAVSNLLRLLNLAKPVQTMLMAGDIDMGHARALLVVDSATQIQLANQIVAKRMSVRDAEKLVTRASAEQAAKPREGKEKSRDIARLEEELSDLLATQVSIKTGARNKGQLIISFNDLDALDGVITRLRGESVES